VYCAYCSEKIRGVPVKQAGDFFCSTECASLASGMDPDDPELFEDDELEDAFLGEDEEEEYN